MANDDDLLKRLGDLAREREQEADAELRAPSIQLRDPGALREAIVKQALAQARPLPLPSNVRPIGRPRVLWVGGIVAAAAAMLLVWLGMREEAPLPRYALLHRGAVEQQRGDAADEVVRLRRGSTLTLELKPAQDVKGKVELRVYAQQGDALTRLQPRAIERSEAGAFRLSILVGPPLSARTNGATLSVLLCRPETCEQAQALVRDASLTEEGTWQILRLQTVFAE